MTNAPTAVDFFAGAGGASCGIHAAGFDLVAAVDENTTALNTHADNLPGYTIAHDCRDVDPSVLPERAQAPTYVHGSPPCKGFSTANDDRSADDPRNALVFDFVDWVDTLRPAVVTMENVTGMRSIQTGFVDRVHSAFREAGYRSKDRTLNAADYGVPQTRKRVITIGIREDVASPSRWFPRPTHAETPTTTLDGRTLGGWVTVEEAIGDLAGHVDGHRPQGENDGTTGAVWRRADRPAHTLKGQGSHTMHLTDQLNEAHQREGRRPLQRGDEPSNTLRAGTPPLKIPNHDDPGLSDFTTVYENFNTAHMTATADTPSPTITAKLTNAPYHYNHDPHHSARTDGGRWDGARRLTVRECARLQSFPDWFRFSGSKTSQYAQVGDAVPPRLQYHIARHLREAVL